jgi:hypothetical protein
VVLEPLSAEERGRHERGIEKIRRRLFRQYTPEDYFVVPNSEQILAASAESCWNAACGHYRVFRFGGLSYATDCCAEDGLCRFSVSHIEADRFTFWLTGARRHTISSLIVRFRDLDEVVYRWVSSYQRFNVARMRGPGTETIKF